MRVNIYAEEISGDIEIIEKTTDEGTFTGLRMYLYLPVTTVTAEDGGIKQVAGKFMHHPGDDDSSAVTFWGKRAMIPVLERMLAKLKDHYN